MKKIIYKSGVVLIGLLLFASCNSWLDKPPLTSYEDDPSFWNNENSVRLYINGFYSLLNGAGGGRQGTTAATSTAPTYNSINGTGSESDFFFNTFTDDQAYFAGNSFDHFPISAPSSASTWSTPYNFIRVAQLLITRMNSSTISDAPKNHYMGIGYFFMAMEYFELVRHYGDVPFVDKYLDQNTDTAMIWGPRVNRDEVMDSVLVFLNNAIAMMYPKAVADADPNLGYNTLNSDIAYALKSRICLYEGSWAKYHEKNTARATQYFTECYNASEALRSGGNYALNMTHTANSASGYRAAYTTAGLSTNKGGEIMLYRKYSVISTPSIVNAVGTQANSVNSPGLTKDAVESFLCTDGRPIYIGGTTGNYTNNPLYMGDESNSTCGISKTVLANRDLRLSATIDSVVSFLQGPYFLNSYYGGRRSQTGYLIIRFNSPLVSPGPYSSTIQTPVYDAPVFWLPEVLLNEAEAAAELGTITQTDVANTINLLRTRAGVASLDVNNVPDDPKRDTDVSPLLWEIRRERRVELMLTSFRYWDIRRWGKVEYLNPAHNLDIFLGARIPDGKPPYTYQSGEVNGYVQFTTDTLSQRVIKDPQDYLDPVPTGELDLYQSKGIDFPQNPGW